MFSIVGIIYFITKDKYFKKFILIVLFLKLFVSMLIFQYYKFDISNIFGDQLVYIRYAQTIYNSSHPFATDGNISHYLYIFMLTIMLNLYDSLFLGTIDLVVSQIGVSTLTHIYIYLTISTFIKKKKIIFLISSISFFFLTLYSYNIFLIRDSWFFLFFIMSIFYLVKFKLETKKKYLWFLIFSLFLLLQMRFFSALFFVVTYYLAFTKNKVKMIISFFITFGLFILTFGLFYNINMIEDYLLRLLEIDNLIEFILYNFEGFFNLSFIRFGEYGIVFKFIRLFIPETIFVLFATYYLLKIRKFHMEKIDDFIRFIAILTIFHISTYFFYSGAEWKIRQSGIMSLVYVLFVAIKIYYYKQRRFIEN